MGQKEYPRSFRIADHLRREISLLIKDEFSDPRVVDVTVTDVKMSLDMRYADVFVVSSVNSNATGIVKVLNRAIGFFRTRLSKRLRLRHLPQIRFQHDAQYEQAMRITALIEDHSFTVNG